LPPDQYYDLSDRMFVKWKGKQSLEKMRETSIFDIDSSKHSDVRDACNARSTVLLDLDED